MTAIWSKAVISRVRITAASTPTAVHPDNRNGEVQIRTVRLMLENLVIHKVARCEVEETHEKAFNRRRQHHQHHRA